MGRRTRAAAKEAAEAGTGGGGGRAKRKGSSRKGADAAEPEPKKRKDGKKGAKQARSSSASGGKGRASKRARVGKKKKEEQEQEQGGKGGGEAEVEANGVSPALFFVDRKGERTKQVKELHKQLVEEGRKERRRERKEKQRERRRGARGGEEDSAGEREEEEDDDDDRDMPAPGSALIVGVDTPLPPSLPRDKRRKLRLKVERKKKRGGLRPAAAAASGRSEERLPAPAASVDDLPFDLWAADNGGARKGVKAEALALANPAAPKRDRLNMERLVVKAGIAPAEEGHSVNPRAEDHQSVLRAAHDFDEREKQERLELTMKLNGTHPRYTVERRFPRGSDRDTEPAPARPAVRAEDRLTRAERNRLGRKRETERDLEARRAEKALLRDAARAPQLAAEVDRELAEQESSRKAAAEAYVPREPRLGKEKLEPRFPDAALSEDLQGSLRTVPVVDSVAAVQFRRLQERRLIEPRKPHKKIKKHGLKPGYKTYRAHKGVEFA